MSFALTERQGDANRLLGGPATHIMLRGGSRSGKTFLLTRATVLRGLKAPGSTHAILRFRFNHLRMSLIEDTLPKVCRLCFPDAGPKGLPFSLNRSDWFATLPGGSKILFGGLDDKERVEKILGQEHSTIYLEECSQISYEARNMAMTRLAQNSGLKLKAYYSANPPTVGHWTYRMFEQRIEPKSGERLGRPDDYVSMRMNPADNENNLPAAYLEQLAQLPERERRRFLEGEYLAQVEGALWSLDAIKRVSSKDVPAMRRIVVAVDPSGCDGEEDFRSDEIGIVAAGLGMDGIGYVLEDATLRGSPEQWGRMAVALYDKHDADVIVAERNFGGAMVESTVRAARRNAPVKVITAARGKHVRAEPVASLYEQERVRHAGHFPDLEDQLCGFSAAGYKGARSPDRADAAVYALTELMLGEGRRAPLVIPDAVLTRVAGVRR